MFGFVYFKYSAVIHPLDHPPQTTSTLLDPLGIPGMSIIPSPDPVKYTTPATFTLISLPQPHVFIVVRFEKTNPLSVRSILRPPR